MEAKQYTVKIIEGSREFTAKERANFKNMGEYVKIDDVAPVDIDIADYVALAVHNERAKDNKDYTKYILIDKDGTFYVTGSTSLWETFFDIMEDMKDADEPWKLRVTKKDSRNREGKYFLTCSVV